VPANVSVTVDCAATLPPALADIDQVRIVFANLIRNAREAMPNGGNLTIRAQPNSHGLAVGFTDTGTGVSSENLHRIMEPLFSTKARGLGLGLAIARAILEKNDGSMTLASELGKGSTFTIKLRAADIE
jgi:two-component system sensor kinase FixL